MNSANNTAEVLHIEEGDYGPEGQEMIAGKILLFRRRQVGRVLGSRGGMVSLAESKRLDGICDLPFQIARGKEMVARAAGIRIVKPSLRDRFRQGV